MSLRRRSVLLQVALLVLIPLILLVGSFAYTVTTSASSALTLTRSKVVMDQLRSPVAALQQALSRERAQVIVYYVRPTRTAHAALQRLQAVTDRAVHSFMAAAESLAVQQSASAGGEKAIAEVDEVLTSLPGLQAKTASRSIPEQQAFTAYNDMIGASYLVLEQAVIQEGNSAQVLPAIAVVELAVSNEYLQQESALLNGNFAARFFPASAHLAFVGLVGAHRLLYQQSYSYLSQPDRSTLNHDVSPAAAAALTAMENKLVAINLPHSPPPVSPATWNAVVTTVSTQTERAVGQAEADLAASARSQADAKLRDLYLTGGLGLAAVVVSLALSLWIAVRLTRRLRGLRDSALEMANVRLPAVVRRLRAGENVDVAAQMPLLKPSPDEIGQVKAAFNTAQRTAVEAAVHEASVRRGISDVFRNLARRSQALLERQVTLLDSLERRAAEPDDLENLFSIDHLTTRMRRHAESLIVLAGDSPNRPFRDAVPCVDVLRAAAAEVEDYTRVRVVCRTSAALASPAVADVIHMLAEFVENATIFSPRGTEVRVTGEMVARGFAVDIEDRGLGMDDEQFAAVNASLANPPLFDPSGSDRLGLFVAAQLARRHDIRVKLRRSDYGGVTAIVLVPLALVVSAKALGEASALGRGSGGSLTAAVREVTAPPVAGPPPVAAPRLVAAPPPAAAPPVRTPPVDLPPVDLPPVDLPYVAAPHVIPAPSANGELSDASDAWEPSAVSPPEIPLPRITPRTDLPEPFSQDPGPASSFMAMAPDEPPSASAGSRSGLTENGLPQRIRQMSLAPQLRRPTASPSLADPAANSRSPEAARSVMSAFQRGWRRGLSEAHGDAGDINSPAHAGPAHAAPAHAGPAHAAPAHAAPAHAAPSHAAPEAPAPAHPAPTQPDFGPEGDNQ
jgi:signal transduction histidine kinase